MTAVLLVMLASVVGAKVCYVEYASPCNFHESMMRATFRIEGPKRGARDTVIQGTPCLRFTSGTAFLMYLRVQSKSGDTGRTCVLVTARHVLDSIGGDTAWVCLRARENGAFRKMPWPIELRHGGRQRWTCLPDPAVDVAIIPFSPPDACDCDALGEWCLPTDSILKRWEITTGDQLLCLGFPLGAESDTAGGFPVLRSGVLGSYPVTPMSSHPRLGFDFEVYGGNSGGPAYICAPTRTIVGSQTSFLNPPLRCIVGLVTSEVLVASPGDTAPRSIKLAKIVPAYFITATLDRLPASNSGRRLGY